jgi:flagellar hook-associated protein 2
VDDAENTLIGGNVGDKLELQIGDGSSGTLSINLEAGKTLEQLRDAINEDESNPGITASVLNVGGGSQRLILTSQESGYDSRIVATETFDAASTALGLTEANKKPDGTPLDSLNDLDAAFSVDGFDVTASSNTVTSVIDGISLDLKQTGDADISIDRDVDAIKESMQGFVDAYNEVQGLIASLGAGELSGDSTLRSLQGQLRGVLNTGPESVSSVFSSLGELGVATQRDGTLSFDSSDFESALNTDFSGVAQLLANDDQGFAFRFAALAESILADDGLIDSREDGINSQIRTLENRQLSLEDRLELKEKAMRSQFAALDSLLGQMQSTSQFLVNQLGLL